MTKGSFRPGFEDLPRVIPVFRVFLSASSPGTSLIKLTRIPPIINPDRIIFISRVNPSLLKARNTPDESAPMEWISPMRCAVFSAATPFVSALRG